MDENDLHWVAGLMEGEGCFSINGANYRPRIRLVMVDEDVILHIKEILGVGSVRETKTPAGKPAFEWSCHKTSEVVPILYALHPIMGERRGAKIEELLSYWRKHQQQGANNV